MIDISYISSQTFTNSTFKNNSAEQVGGSLFFFKSNSISLLEKTLISNSYSKYGGGIYSVNSKYSPRSSIEFENNYEKDSIQSNIRIFPQLSKLNIIVKLFNSEIVL